MVRIRRLAGAGACGEDAGGWRARALSACAGVEVRRRLACTGLTCADEGGEDAGGWCAGACAGGEEACGLKSYLRIEKEWSSARRTG